MAIKNEDLMNELKSIIEDNHRFEDSDLFPFESEVSDGSSSDNFTNFTDGYVDVSAYFFPGRDTIYPQGDGDPEQQKRADNVDKIIKNLENIDDDAIELFYEKNSDDGKFTDEFESLDSFKDWYKNYEYGSSDKKYDDLADDVREEMYDYYSDSPAYVGVRALIYDSKDSGGVVTLQSYFNDDLSYKRESVGGWAKMQGFQSGDGSNIGNHYIYDKEFEWHNLDELKQILEDNIDAAYSSLGL